MAGFVRTYSVVSLVVMAIAAAVMFAHHRAVIIQSIEVIAETSSVTTTRMALHPIRVDLASYIETANRAGGDPAAVTLPQALQDAIAEMMRDSRVVRIKIYRRDGVVLFSTRTQQIGDVQEANLGFSNAMDGKVSVEIIYRDSFNTFDRATEEDNLVQTYFPVRASPTAPVVGVFEVYTDVNSLVIEAERSELVMLVGTIALVGAIYVLLVVLVYRSDRQVAAQQRTIAEKNALLERLSLDSMRREERERKRFATELHEGLAQSLSAVKLALESIQGGARDKSGEMLSAIIPSLREAIGHARAIAEDLHPPSLDEFGLGPTVRTLLHDFESVYPGCRIEPRIALDEATIPATLKIAVYRILENVVAMLRRYPKASRVRVALGTQGGELELRVEDDAGIVAAGMRGDGGAGDLRDLAAELSERVMISKGRLSVGLGTAGTAVLRAAWQL